MRILFCNYEYPPLGGGGGVVNAMLAEELASRHQVTVLTSCGPNLTNEETLNNVRIIRVPVYTRRQMAAANFPSMAAYIMNGLRYGTKLLQKEQFDIINTHFALPSGPVGDSLSRKFNIPNVLSVHGGDLYDPSKFTSPHRHLLLRMWVNSLLHKADAVVGQSRNTNENVTNFYDANLKPALIPLGINRPQFPATTREELGFKAQEKILVTVGRQVSRKANDRLITVFSRLKQDNCKLVLIGSGPQQESLQALAKQLNVADKVVFAGFVSEEKKFALLANADIYVSTSQHEGFGLVFLEAMAAGLPVMCYNHGGQTDFLEHGKTGALLELNDESTFLTELNRLLSDQALVKQVGDYNKQKVEQYFIENCAQQYETLFENLVKQSKGWVADTSKS